jgi:electron transfer flavoprotein-quinone oxidoreductase
MDGIAVIYTNRDSLSLCIGANLFDLMCNTVRPYEMMEEFKAHPMVAPLIRSGRPREYTAHWLPEGGYDTIPSLYGDGYLIAGDSGMLFNTLHREGSNMAMTSGRLAALAIIEALEGKDTRGEALSGYGAALQRSYVINDMKKYRRFNRFLLNHKEIFTTLPRLGAHAAREMLTVDGVSKKEKQGLIRKKIQEAMPLTRLARLLWAAARSIV